MRIFILLLLSLYSAISTAQSIESEIDTLKAYENLTIGDSLVKNGKYHVATQYFVKSAANYKKNNFLSRQAIALNRQSEALWRSQNFSEAKKLPLRRYQSMINTLKTNQLD